MSKKANLLIFAHRGASASKPENTIEAFREALSQGSDWVELDVHLTADDGLIVHHDQWYRDERTVYEVPVDERPDAVPVLAEALDACAGMGVNVEIKNASTDRPGAPHDVSVADRVLETLAARRRSGIDEQILISSFDPRTLDRVRVLEPAIATALLVVDPLDPVDAVDSAVAGGHSALHPWYPCIDALLVDRCHRAGLAVNAWTVDDPTAVKSLAALGVDGIITNTPATVRALLS